MNINPVTDLPPDVSLTVYSVVWPTTEALVRQCMTQEAEQMLARHRHAQTKHQDGLHQGFFDAWKSFVAPIVYGLDVFGEMYPCAGSSEAIREVIRQATWKQQAIVVFDGEYEGYESLAAPQGTQIIRVVRSQWRETLDQWRVHGTPWGSSGAQWWISQPSAIDGNVWPDFLEWLSDIEHFQSCQVWVDLCYVGMCAAPLNIQLDRPNVAGVVFSLSKVMGAYYRRIGGCLSRETIPGLWGNRWFKNIDSLYLGQRWLEQVGSASDHAHRCARYHAQAVDLAVSALGGADFWVDKSVVWVPSDVPLLMTASRLTPDETIHPTPAWWQGALRGRIQPASLRLCLTPTIDRLLEIPHVA